MSLPAASFALLLHATVAFLLWWSSQLHPTDDPEEKAVEVTMEAPPPPEPKPEPKPEPTSAAEAPKPPPPAAAAAKPVPQPPLNMRGLMPAAPLGEKTEGAGTPRNQAREAKPTGKPEDPSPDKSEAPQQALAPPPAPTPPAEQPPPLEKELPPVEAPPAPLTSRDFAKTAPPEPKPEPKPQPKPPVQAQPQRQPAPQQTPQQSLAPSPLSRLSSRGAPPASSTRQDGPPSPFVNPADARARLSAADSYLQEVNYKVSQQPVIISSEWARLAVAVRFTIARNGQLVDVSIARSSGNPDADRNMIQTFRAASPFPPLPQGIPGDSITYTIPVGFVSR
jgi:protein TonB